MSIICDECGSEKLVESYNKYVCMDCGSEKDVPIKNIEVKDWKTNSSENHINNVVNELIITLNTKFSRLKRNIVLEICNLYKNILIEQTNRGEIKLGIIGNCIKNVCRKNKIFISDNEIMDVLQISKKKYEKSTNLMEKSKNKSDKIKLFDEYYDSPQLTVEEILKSFAEMFMLSDEEINNYVEIAKKKFDDELEHYQCAALLYEKVSIEKLIYTFDISKNTLNKYYKKLKK